MMRVCSISLSAALGFGMIAGFTGLLATPAADAMPSLLVQDSGKAVTVTGQAIGTDGQPASKIPVTLSYELPPPSQAGGAGTPEDLAVQAAQEGKERFKPIGRQMTDESGRFTFRNVRQEGELRLEVGMKERTEWAIKAVFNDGKKDTIDVGTVQLQPRAGPAPRER